MRQIFLGYTLRSLTSIVSQNSVSLAAIVVFSIAAIMQRHYCKQTRLSENSQARLMFAGLYGRVYQSFELPGTKIYFNQEVHHGLVLISEGKGHPRPARLELTHDTLIIQVPVGFDSRQPSSEVLNAGIRHVVIRRQRDGGLGLSVKGGTDKSCKVPVLISKIFKDHAADLTGQVYVGDAILEVNGINIEGYTHEDAVNCLRDAGDEVALTVRHHRNMAAFLRAGSFRRSRDGTSLDRSRDFGSLRSNRSATSDTLPGGEDGAPKGWRNLVKISLPMANVSRYLWGTDKLRPNGFEVRAVDDTSSGVILCEEPKIMEDWIRFIRTNISNLNNKSIKTSNKYLHPSELIVYLGWVSERVEESSTAEAWQKWEPKFVIMKGSDVCFFQTPPLSSVDLTTCCNSYKIYETHFQVLKETNRLDSREFAYTVDTSSKTKHYMSTESKEQLLQLEGAWQRATYYSVQRLGSKTFACNYQGQPSALTVDFNKGLSLYDIHNKVFIWRHKFSQLKTSSDDGRMRLRMVFSTAAPTANGVEKKEASLCRHPNGIMSLPRSGNHQRTATEVTRDIDCGQVYELVYSIHAFMVAKIVSVDPDFLKSR